MSFPRPNLKTQQVDEALGQVVAAFEVMVSAQLACALHSRRWALAKVAVAGASLLLGLGAVGIRDAVRIVIPDHAVLVVLGLGGGAIAVAIGLASTLVKGPSLFSAAAVSAACPETGSFKIWRR